MPIRQANAEWNGDLKQGKGTMSLGSGAYTGPYSFGSRFEEGEGTNPEELIGAAHAGCFSMALSNILAEAGHKPESVKTDARVHLTVGDDGASISEIDLTTVARVPGLEANEFQQHVGAAKSGCPVSKLLKGATINVEATLD
jgi:lipoyl-dependent peroxiredoxin